MDSYLPDWSEDTIHKLDKAITKSYTVFEWGTGYSTLWLAQRAGKVITMEHNPDWFYRIQEIARDLGITNIEQHLYPLDNEKYYTKIHECAGIDFIIVDGRNRVRCFNEAVKLGKYIMLDDSERDKYKEVFTHDYKFINTLPTPEGQRATIFECVKLQS
jgi:hypothetical protein